MAGESSGESESAKDARLIWNQAGDWDQLLRRAGKSSLEQSLVYGDALAAVSRLTVERGVIARGGAPIGIVQAFRRRFAGLGSLVRIARGPLLLDGTTREDRDAALRLVRGSFLKRRRDFLFWLPEIEAAASGAMDVLPCRRMVSGYSSAWLDLRPEADDLRAGLAGNWRTSLKAAEGSKLRVSVDHGGASLVRSMAAYDAFHRKKRFSGPAGALILAMADAGATAKDVVHVSTSLGDEVLAAIVLIRHGVSATYYAGWTSGAGRRAQAHNLLLWRGIETLKASGTQWLDLGGLDTECAPGIARFKLGTGAKPFTLSGTYF